MQTGEFITDRLMPRLLRDICEQRGIAVASFCDDWLLEFTKDNKTAHVLGYNFSLNNSAAAGIAQDKVATYELLNYHDIPAVEHRLLRTKAGDANWQQWPWQAGMVMKPLNGTSGHGVGVVRSVDEAQAWMEQRGIEAWAASPLLDIQREIRVMMLDNRVLLAYEKVPVVIEGLKMFNLGKGATPKNIELPGGIEILAKTAMQKLGLRLAAVDIIELAGGEYTVLEINDGFMMEHYARLSNANQKQTHSLYESVLSALFE